MRETHRPEARHGRLRRSRPVATVLRLVGIALAVVVVASGSIAAYAVWDVARTLKPGVDLLGHEDEPAPEVGAIDGPVTVLIAASDSGGGDVAAYGKRGEHLNDVTMLLHISADHRSATVVSFPRDLIVPIASCPREDGKGSYPAQTNKINVALTYGGLPCIVKTVENLTGMSIPYAALTEFQGVVGMSNAIGGVTVCVATPIHDRAIPFDLDAGEQTLVGQQAVQFLRVRYGLGDGSDLGRVSNQQLFLSALVRKVKTPETLGNPVKVYELAKAVASNITPSTSLANLNTIASIGIAVKDIPFDDVAFVQYPGASGTRAGQNGVIPITSAADVLFDALRADRPIAITGTTSPVGGTQLDPNAPPPAEPTPTSTASPPGDVVQLPSTITGQTAAQQTCTRGQRAGP